MYGVLARTTALEAAVSPSWHPPSQSQAATQYQTKLYRMIQPVSLCRSPQAIPVSPELAARGSSASTKHRTGASSLLESHYFGASRVFDSRRHRSARRDLPGVGRGRAHATTISGAERELRVLLQ